MKIAPHFASWSIISGWITLNDEYFLAAGFNKSSRTKTAGCHPKPHLWAGVRSSGVSTDSRFLSVWPVMTEELPHILPEITVRETGFLLWQPCTAQDRSTALSIVLEKVCYLYLQWKRSIRPVLFPLWVLVSAVGAYTLCLLGHLRVCGSIFCFHQCREESNLHGRIE